MISSFRSGRPLALAAACVALSAAAASAQTIVARNVPAGSTVEVLVNSTLSGSGVANAGGDATIVINPPLRAAKAEAPASIFVDTCAAVRRVIILERDVEAPAPAEGCVRRLVPGTFIVRGISTVVVRMDAANPSVLLRQGSFSLAPPRTWRGAPLGFIVFGGAGLTGFRDLGFLACGNIVPCDAKDSGAAYSIGTAYWLAPAFGVELSYLIPSDTRVVVAGDAFSFDTTSESHLLLLGAKLAVPLGPVRLFGGGGANYHRATLTTNQTTVGSTIKDTFQLTTAGWGWQVSAGGEAWVAPAFAIYAEAGTAWIKGKARRPGDGEVNDRATFVMVGLRVNVKR
ncbi:MAG: porin family protein [Acidobacteriota bacterium]|nr:porin family protein [Acidobacteriota bacterium]